jgi:hypothetical protein
MSTREALHALVDQLPEQELLAAHRNAVRNLDAARQERGERISLEEARLRLGL